ncbi:MAG: hypothetical protein LBF93_04300 [Zoogloeaceae bacterium]|nr:hypothetical protein [Zoogloeaceae bacterium]
MNTKWKSRYVPIMHQYVVEDAAGDEVATIKARPGTESDKIAAGLIAAAPELYAALWLLLGDRETEQTAVMSEKEKKAIARHAIKFAGGLFADVEKKILSMSKWYEGDDE